MTQKTNIQQRTDQTMGWFLEKMDAGTNTGHDSGRRGEMKKTEHPKQRRGHPTNPTKTSQASNILESKLHQLTCKLDKVNKFLETIFKG